MYKLRKVYICDHCGKITLPERARCADGIVRSCVPVGWGCLFAEKYHLCDRCYAAFERLSEVDEDENA